MVIEICIGSSCHIRGSQDIVELMQKAVEENRLDCDVTLAGCFCVGKCNSVGVTVRVDDEVFTGITKENFKEFFNGQVLAKL